MYLKVSDSVEEWYYIFCVHPEFDSLWESVLLSVVSDISVHNEMHMVTEDLST